MLVIGIDEAGRGAVLSSLIIAAVLDTDRSEVNYREMGCRDSKEMTAKAREICKVKINQAAKEVHYIEITATEIDELRKFINLNEIEAKKTVELIGMFKTKPDRIIVDCVDNDPKRYLQRLRKYLEDDIEIVAEHKADVNYPIVSAASIIAKTKRDEKMRDLENEFDIKMGSGYPSDPFTKQFLKDYFEKHGKLPSFARKSWDTSRKIMDKRDQKTLGDF